MFVLKEPVERVWSKNFVFLIICNFLLYMNLQMSLPSIPAFIKEHFPVSDFTTSLVTGLFALAAIASRIYTGGVMYKRKWKTVLYAGLGIALLTTAGIYWCGVIALILLVRIGFGFGFGIASTTFPTVASNALPTKRMGEGMGFFGFSTSLAMSLGPILGLSILDGYGFGALITITSLALLIIVPLVFSIKDVPDTLSKQANLNGKQDKTRIMDRNILLPFFLNLLLSVTFGGLISFIAMFGKEAHISNVGSFFLINALVVLLVRPFSGKLFDRKGHIAVIIPGAVLVIVGLVSLSFSDSLPDLLLSAFFYGLGYGVLQPSIQAWMINEVSDGQRGVANSMFLNSIDLGVALGAMALGIVCMATSYSNMYLVCAFIMVAFLMLYVVSLLFKTRNKQKKIWL